MMDFCSLDEGDGIGEVLGRSHLALGVVRSHTGRYEQTGLYSWHLGQGWHAAEAAMPQLTS